MHSDLPVNILWILCLFATAAVAFAILRRRTLKEWPSLFGFCCLEITMSALLYLTSHHYAWYFYIFWIGTVLRIAVRLWLLADALRSIPNTDFIGFYPRAIVAAAGLLMAAGSALLVRTGGQHWVYALSGFSESAKTILATIILWDLCVCYAVLTFCMAVLLAVFKSGLGWEKTGAQIACGMGVLFISGALHSAMISSDQRTVRVASDYIEHTIRLAVLCSWYYALSSPPEVIDSHAILRRLGFESHPKASGN